MLNVLIACEESQAVCKEFRRLGHRAFSCDIQACSGGHPEWHIKGDALAVINGNCEFLTEDGNIHEQKGRWDIQETRLYYPTILFWRSRKKANMPVA